MKQILCLSLICVMLISFCSCGIVKEITDPALNGTGIHLNSDKLQDLFNQGLDGLKDILGQHAIQASAEALNNEAGVLCVYEDKIVLTVSTDAVRDKISKSGVSLESIKEERRHADMAQMEYTLQYQYCVTLNVNQQKTAAVCYATVTEDTLNNTVDITIPIDAEAVGTTVYELLQGRALTIESCLQHGTDTTEVIIETYYLDKAPDNTAKTLKMQDRRKSAVQPQ